MGHTEMLLAVAGLDDDSIEERTRRLASGEWSDFTAQEQAAFHFARKHALRPREVTDKDVGRLVDTLGAERALDTIWWSSRCHYMTRVADALQLPLERDNVFLRPPTPAVPTPPR